MKVEPLFCRGVAGRDSFFVQLREDLALMLSALRSKKLEHIGLPYPQRAKEERPGDVVFLTQRVSSLDLFQCPCGIIVYRPEEAPLQMVCGESEGGAHDGGTGHSRIP